MDLFAILASLGSTLAFLWIFWGFYVLVMGIYRAHLDKRLTPVTRVLSAPFVVVGAVFDVVANITIASIIFLEFPRELLVTARLKRHIRSGTGWRHKLSTYVCDHVLDVFDPTGNHC